MTVSFVSGATNNGVTLLKPAGLQAGDVMFGFVATAFESSPSAPAGWTTFHSTSDFLACWKVADPATDPASWTGTGGAARSRVIAYRGVSNASPVAVQATTSDVSHVGQSGVTVTWDSIVAPTPTIIIGAARTDTATTTVTDPPGSTQRWQPLSANAGSAQGYAFDKVVPAGQTGTFSVAFPNNVDGNSDTQPWFAILFALNDAEPVFDDECGWGTAYWKGRQVANAALPGFEATGYDDSSWATVQLPLASGGACALQFSDPANTFWGVNSDFLLRRSFQHGGFTIEYAIDNAVYFYMNGTLFHSFDGGGCPTRGHFVTVPASDDPIVLAIRCNDYGVETYFDCEIPHEMCGGWMVGQVGIG